MESESVRADPRMLNIVLTVMEHLAVQLLVSVVPSVLAHTIEFGLLQ